MIPISNQLPNFWMNISTFTRSYIAAFLLLWRLAIVAFPFLVLLVIPGLIYERTLMGLARAIREEYNQAGANRFMLYGPLRIKVETVERVNGNLRFFMP